MVGPLIKREGFGNGPLSKKIYFCFRNQSYVTEPNFFKAKYSRKLKIESIRFFILLKFFKPASNYIHNLILPILCFFLFCGFMYTNDWSLSPSCNALYTSTYKIFLCMKYVTKSSTYYRDYIYFMLMYTFKRRKGLNVRFVYGRSIPNYI